MNKVFLIILTVAALAGCTFRATDEDWEKHGKVHVMLDWGMRSVHSGVFDYYFYTAGSTVPLVRRGDAVGYEGILPFGQYAVAVCNPDGTNLNLSMQKGYAVARATAHTLATSKSAASLIAQPSNLYGAGKDEIRVAADITDTPVILNPVSLCKEVLLHILVVGGDGNVQITDGELSGIPPEVCIPTGTPCPGSSVSVAFTTAAVATSRYAATLSLFGLRTSSDGPTDLLLNLQLPDGQPFAVHTDISRQIDEALTDGLATRIELDLEVHPLASGGFTLEVTDWRTGEAEAGGPLVNPTKNK